MKKDNHDDVYDSDGPQVEPSLLLEYLIQKSEELSTRNSSWIPSVVPRTWSNRTPPFPELYKEFVEIVSGSEYPVSERAEKCKDIFIEALDRPQLATGIPKVRV